MKIQLSIVFLSIIYFFNSCSNPSQNQKAITFQSDTGVLTASNEQNLVLDTPVSEINTDKAKKQNEVPQTNKSVETKENEVASDQSHGNSTFEEDPGFIEMPTVEIEEKVEEKINEDVKFKDPKKEEIAVNTETKTSEFVLPFNQDKWDQLLRKYVSASGKVNYKGIKSEKAKLNAYIKELESNPIQANWSKATKMAYWINVYNAFTIKMIVDNYPVSSITKLHGGKPWDVKSINLSGKTYNLNNIENDILRPKYKDARIHFAVNCAAQSCPPILNRAWTENNLNEMLEKQANAFINNAKYNTIKSNEVEISKIFEWYASDFGNIVDFLNKYSNTKINANAKVKYKDYDWSLNE